MSAVGRAGDNLLTFADTAKPRKSSTLLGLNSINISRKSLKVGRDGSCECIKVGRPQLDISKEDIAVLRQLNFSWTKIAEILGTSRRTLYRRLEKYDIDPNSFTDISQPDLVKIVKDIKSEQPNTGEVMIQGQLLQRGIKIQRSKLRSVIHFTDHANTVERRSAVIRRRVYSNPHPNAVWHVDGNHKMIRWRFVIHAGVDGFSRSVVFIKCSTNNLATTVVSAFLEGVSAFGRPARIRSDHGGENVEIWRYMLYTYNNPSCVLTGRSVHNVRVERLWRDVTRCISSNFIDVFHALEAEGILDPLNEVDIYCLHFVYLPRINKLLADFQGGWNHHSLSTEGNRSPLQLFAEGLSVINQYESTSPEQLPPTDISIPDEIETVQVPSTKFLPCDQVLTELLMAVNPMCECNDMGKSLFSTSIQLVGHHLQNGCLDCRLE